MLLSMHLSSFFFSTSTLMPTKAGRTKRNIRKNYSSMPDLVRFLFPLIFPFWLMRWHDLLRKLCQVWHYLFFCKAFSKVGWNNFVSCLGKLVIVNSLELFWHLRFYVVWFCLKPIWVVWKFLDLKFRFVLLVLFGNFFWTFYNGYNWTVWTHNVVYTVTISVCHANWCLATSMSPDN